MAALILKFLGTIASCITNPLEVVKVRISRISKRLFADDDVRMTMALLTLSLDWGFLFVSFEIAGNTK